MGKMARRFVAINDYIAKDDSEISFVQGDVIFVPVMADGPTLKGVFKGKVGSFPKIYVNDTTVEIKQPGKTSRVKAIRDNVAAEGSEEHSFEKGAVMFVVADVDAKHWKGVWGGKPGLIPKECVVNAETVSEEKKAELAGMRGLAIRSFLNPDSHAVTFSAGDIVFVPKPGDVADGNVQGVSNGCVGAFPLAFVEDTKDVSREDLAAKKDKLLEDSKDDSVFIQVREWKEARKAAAGGGAA